MAVFGHSHEMSTLFLSASGLSMHKSRDLFTVITANLFNHTVNAEAVCLQGLNILISNIHKNVFRLNPRSGGPYMSEVCGVDYYFLRVAIQPPKKRKLKITQSVHHPLLK